jgi:hypothetical protein
MPLSHFPSPQGRCAHAFSAGEQYCPLPHAQSVEQSWQFSEGSHNPLPHVAACWHGPQSVGQFLQFSPFSLRHTPFPHDSEPPKKTRAAAAIKMTAKMMYAVFDSPVLFFAMRFFSFILFYHIVVIFRVGSPYRQFM